MKNIGGETKDVHCGDIISPDTLFENFTEFIVCKFDSNELKTKVDDYTVTKAHVTVNLLPLFNESKKANTVSTALDSKNTSFHINLDETLCENKQALKVPKSTVNTLRKHFLSPMKQQKTEPKVKVNPQIQTIEKPKFILSENFEIDNIIEEHKKSQLEQNLNQQNKDLDEVEVAEANTGCFNWRFCRALKQMKSVFTRKNKKAEPNLKNDSTFGGLS